MKYEKILTLSYFLRTEGVNVSIRSSLMACHVYDMFNDKLSLKELKEALKCVYIKNKEDLSRYDRAFNKVFVYNKYTPEKKNHTQKRKNYTPIDIDEDESDIVDENTGRIREDTTRETIIRRRLENEKIVDKRILNNEINSLNTIDYRVYNICHDFSRKIANQRSLRKKQEKSRSVNIPKTIRSNLKNGGHLINLVYQKPPVHKSKHIFLCDISGSCEWATTWFFAMMCGCFKSFDKLTVYDFDHRIVNVTEALDVEYKNSFQINVAHQSLGLRPRGHSDMTKAFTQFLSEVELDRHTDVIILTDCRDWNGERNDGVLKSATILRKIIVKSRNVYIFNPENRIRWNTPTSCVRDYEEVGARIFQTNTLNQLANVIKEI